MASVDGSTSLQGTSDELYDVICGPCQTDNLYKQAHHYCNECRENLCNSCKDVHRKLAISKNHTILPAKQIPAPNSDRHRPGFAPYCSCNKNQQVDFFCEDHKEVICIPCKMVKHRHCKTVGVQEKSAGYTTAHVNSILARITSLIHEFDTMQKQRKSGRKELKRLTEECKKKIEGFRASIDAILDNLEKKVMDEVGIYVEEQSRQIDHYITALTTGLQMLNADKKQLEDAKTNQNKVKMFTIEIQVSKSLKEYEAMLAEMENDVSELTLTFEGNKKLADLQSEITALGSLKRTGRSQGSSHKGRNKKVLLGKQATFQNQVRVRSSDDNNKPRISGCTFMPSGHAVLCDNRNANVKLLDKDLVLREHLKLCSTPLDVSVVDDKNVIITLPRTKQLQYVQAFPQLKTGRTIQLDKRCRGIAVFGDEIYTTQFDELGQGEVHVLDLNGSRKRKLQTDVKFYCSLYITVSSSGKKVFVSGGCYDTATVTCMTTDGNLVYVYQYKDEELTYPKGMYVDAEDNILICDPGSHTVQMITANGKKYGTLLSSNDEIDWPLSIAYRETDDTLLVGCDDQDHASSYKLV